MVNDKLLTAILLYRHSDTLDIGKCNRLEENPPFGRFTMATWRDNSDHSESCAGK